MSDPDEKVNDEFRENGTVSQDTHRLVSPYSVLIQWGKKAFVIIAGSLIFPLSSNIYLFALNTFSEDLKLSVSLTNLTIITYLVQLSRQPPKNVSCGTSSLTQGFNVLPTGDRTNAGIVTVFLLLARLT